MILQIHQFAPENLLELLRNICNEGPVSPGFEGFVNALSRAIEERKVERYDRGVVVRLDSDWEEAVKEIETTIMSSRYANSMFVTSLLPIDKTGDAVVIISPPVTQGMTSQVSPQEIVGIARLGEEAHSLEEAMPIASRLEAYWPIMGKHSTPFVKVVANDVKLPDFYDVVRAAVAMKYASTAPAVTLHLAGQSNAAATFVLRALVAAGQDELARILCEAYGGRVLVDTSIIAQYRQYMPPVTVQSAELGARLRRCARLAIQAINHLYAKQQIGDMGLPPASPVENEQQFLDSVRLLRQFCSACTSPKKNRAPTSHFDTQEIVDAALLVLGHYLYACQAYRWAPFPLARFRSQIPSPPTMFTEVWKLMSSNDQMSLIKAAQARGIEEVPSITKEVQMSQIAMAASSQVAEVQSAALRKALERLEVILVVDISGSMRVAIDIATGLANRFREASPGDIKTIVFGGGKVEVYGNLPESLIPDGDTPGDPAVVECANWAQSIIASGKPGVCAVLITDCEFNTTSATVVFGRGAYLQSGSVKKSAVSPDRLKRVKGLHFVVVRIGRRAIPSSVSLLGEDVQVVQMQSSISDAITNTIKALLDISNRIKKEGITWKITGQRLDIEYVRRQYQAMIKGESPEPGITIEIKAIEE